MAVKKSARKKPASKKPGAKKPATKFAAKKPASKKPAAKRASAKRSAAAPAPAPVKSPSGPRVVHWEVQAADLVKQQSFFADLFGWRIDSNNPMNYGMVASGGHDSIGGGIGGAMDSTSRVTFYVQVPDVNASLAKAEALGAKTVMPRMNMGMVIMGQFTDLEGNVIGLVEGA